MCRMLRMLGRFSCCALQKVWTPAMNVALEALLNDPIEQIRCVSIFCLSTPIRFIHVFVHHTGDPTCHRRIRASVVLQRNELGNVIRSIQNSTNVHVGILLILTFYK